MGYNLIKGVKKPRKNGGQKDRNLVYENISTIGEALFVPAAPVVVDQNSPVKVKGRNQGLVNVFSSIGKAVGPALGGVAIVKGGYQTLFLMAILLLLFSEVLFLNFKRK